MFLSVIGVPQVVEHEGKVYNFDGKIGALPCTEEYFAQRKSKKGPKGARSLLCFNSLRGIMSVDGGNDYKQAHNNSRNLIKTTGTPIDLRVDLEDYDRCFDLLNGVQTIELVHSYTQLVKKFLNTS